MAAAFTIVEKIVAGNVRMSVVDVALDATYAAGGYAVTAANVGLQTITHVSAQMKTAENLLPMFDLTNSKLKILKGAGTTTVTTGSGAFSELSTNDTYASATVIVRLFCVGLGANVG